MSAMPQPIRASRLHLLLSVAERHDRWGTMPPADGQEFLEQLPGKLRELGDFESLGAYLSHVGVHTEKDGSHAQALTLLREAVATGHPTPAAVDRLTVHLVKDEQWAEAAAALELALRQPIPSDTLRERLTRRLGRCRRNVR
jgi:hypothetical protein